MTLISIIIPCYNTELTLSDTLESVLKLNFEDWEAIIINDGSTDSLETIALNYVEKDNRFKYHKKENGGLASARNFGIQNSKGKYILPLDSDNLLDSNFISKAIPFFNNDSNLGVVYGDAKYFGEKDDVRIVGEFDKYRILNSNYIDACALIKKDVFNEVGLYDAFMPHQGHEDWEFWIRVINTKFTFFYIPEIVFHYRVLKSSMIRSFTPEMENKNIRYIKNKHKEIYLDAYNELYEKYINLKSEATKTILQRIKRKLKKYVKYKL